MSLDDKRSIEELLAESDLEASDGLHGTLMELRAEGAGPVPEPSGKLARIMSSNVTALRPRRRAMKAAGLGIAVAAAAGLGVSGVAAASPQFRSAADSTFQQLVRFFDSGPAVAPSDPAEAERREASNDASTDGEGAQLQPAAPGSAPAPSSPAEKSGESPGEIPGHGPAEPGDRIPDIAGDRTIPDPPRHSGRGHLEVPLLPALPGNPAGPARPEVPAPPAEGHGSQHGQPRDDVPLPGPPRHLDLPAVPGSEVLPGEWTDLPRPTQPGIKK